MGAVKNRIDSLEDGRGAGIPIINEPYEVQSHILHKNTLEDPICGYNNWTVIMSSIASSASVISGTGPMAKGIWRAINTVQRLPPITRLRLVQFREEI